VGEQQREPERTADATRSALAEKVSNSQSAPSEDEDLEAVAAPLLVSFALE
jgi:hypothetical protein